MAQPLYSTSVQISQFRGLNQAGDGYNLNMQYAREAENVNVEGGSFQPMRKGLQVEQELDNPIGTLTYLHNRFGTDPRTLLVAISDGRVYTKDLDGDDEWEQRYPSRTNTGTEDEPVWTENEDPLTENDCDWLTYEISLYPDFSTGKKYVTGQRVRYRALETDPWKNYRCKSSINAGAWNSADWEEVEGTDPVDILLFTNAKDGMYCLYGDDLSVVPVATPKKFGVITMFNERVWGSRIDGDPDMLVYSKPYDPFNWEADQDIPEDGAGDIQMPTWDGDIFIGLKQYGSYLLAVKRNSIWRIYGTNPGEFVLQMQYGGGTIVENTFVVHNDCAYMLGKNGMMRYDGNGAFPFIQEQTEVTFHDHVNMEAISQATAGMRGETYCLALPVNGSTFCNVILEYDERNRSISYRTNISVKSFLQVDNRLFYTSATDPGRVYELRDDVGETLPCRWISGYQDLGMKSSIKSAFMVYMMVESEAPVELRLGIRTEKKLKQKVVYTKPGKMLRKRLNLQGREFRLEIESYSAVPFTIAGGIKIDLELDPD